MAAFRAVLDTNVVLAAHRSTHPASPNREVLERWRRGEFTLLYSDDVTLEYGDKMIEHRIARADVLGWMGLVQLLGEWVKIETFHLGSTDLIGNEKFQPIFDHQITFR